jgi:hypothetical protein
MLSAKLSIDSALWRSTLVSKTKVFFIMELSMAVPPAV